MAQIQLPAVAPFKPHGDPTSVSQRFAKWKKSFEYFLGASAITSDARKKATLLHLIGHEVQEISDTLTPASESYDSTLNALDQHFSVQKNIPFERSVFHQCKQREGESLEQYVTRLRQLAATCDYGPAVDEQIRDQVIAACSSSKLRKRLLAEPELTLQKCITIGQTLESAHHHTKEIESTSSKGANDEQYLNFLKWQNQKAGNARKRGKSKISCGRCGAKGHFSSECRRSKNHICSKCGKMGHFQSLCHTKAKTPSRNVPQTSRALTEELTQDKNVLSATADLDDDDDDVYAFSTNKEDMKRNTHSVLINGSPIDMFIDSGTTVDILDEDDFKQLKEKPVLRQTKVRIFPYQSQVPLTIYGVFSGTAKACGNSHSSKFYVAKGKHGSLLSRTTAEALDLLRVGPPTSAASHPIQQQFANATSDTTPSLDSVLDKHKEIFKGIGKLKNFEVKLHVNPNVTPVQQPIRRIPYHTRKKVTIELQRLLDLDIIERVNGPTSWINPVVVVPKTNDRIRLCLDMRRANEAIIRERHVIPTMSDILPELHEAKYFCKLDLREGYHQLCLSKESRPITCFATHQGLFQYKRLIYGVNTAFEIFQKQIELVLSGIDGTKNISDDVLIWGSTKEEAIERLEKVLTSFDKYGLKINKSKCLFLVEKLVYSGYTLSADGISPDEHKVQAVKDCKTPTTVSEVRSFLGIVNFCKQFIHDYSTITAPLRLLTKKGQLFHWSEAQQKAFSTLKDRLCSAEVMA